MRATDREQAILSEAIRFFAVRRAYDQPQRAARHQVQQHSGESSIHEPPREPEENGSRILATRREMRNVECGIGERPGVSPPTA